MATTTMNETRIAYSDTGTGEPVVLIHCSAASGSQWRGLCETLGEDLRSIAPDQWGCGKSGPWTGRGAFSLAEEAASILDIIRSIGMHVHLVGHSWSGAVALRVTGE